MPLVYFLQHPVVSHMVKIGYTMDIWTRAIQFEHELEDHYDLPMSIDFYAIALFDCPPRLEKEIHQFLCNHRIDGEWFQKKHTLAFLQIMRSEHHSGVNLLCR